MKTRRKALALVLSLLLVIALVPLSAYATTITETDHLTPGSGIDTLTLSGVSTYTCTRTDENYTALGYTNKRYTYNITVPASTTDNTVMTIEFDPHSTNDPIVSPIAAGGPIQYFAPMIVNAKDTDYDVSLTNGTASLTVYVHHGITNNPTIYGQFDTYIFNIERGYPISISSSDPVHIVWRTNAPTTGDVELRNSTGQLPDSFTLWVYGTGTVTQTPENGTGSNLSSIYNDSGNYAYTVNLLTTDSTITTTSGGQNYTINVPSKSNGDPVPQGSAPSSVISYLPLGQFATGTGWGTASGKFANKTSLESTGVSLGALGGYIEFDFGEGGIVNDPKNPYGVDFVIYGNAFDGNPEPGAVQVSVDGSVWYELAGSRYYDAAPNTTFVPSGFSNAYSGALRNADVTYTKNTNWIKAVATNGTKTLTANIFTTNIAWWPDVSCNPPEYQEFVNYATDSNGNAHTGDDVTVTYGGDSTNSTLVFGGITAIKDSNSNSDYAFGYADVTPNGSPSHYGAAVNPYTAYTSSKTGGDGFDLEWAVDITTGLPVSITSNMAFRYVRVYSAVLDNGTFGETSAEICGIFSAYRTNTNSVGRTNGPSEVSFVIKNPSTGITTHTENPTIPANRGTSTCVNNIVNAVTEVNANSINVSITAISGANVYVNGTLLTQTSTNGTNGTFEGTIDAPVSGQLIRVIVQYGSEAPYLCIFN